MIIRDEQGLTLLEVIIGMAITSMLALGVGQMFSLGLKAMDYADTRSTTTVQGSNFARLFGTDTAAADDFYIAGRTTPTSPQTNQMCTTWRSGAFTSIRPLVEMSNTVQRVGYEVRWSSTSNTGQIWRVLCSAGSWQATNTDAVMVLAGVAAPTPVLGSSDPWVASLQCTRQQTVNTGTGPTTVVDAQCLEYSGITGSDSTLNIKWTVVGLKWTFPSDGKTVLPITAISGSRSGI